MQRPSGETTAARNPGLEALLTYPLVQAIGERRTRRVARGCSILAGPLSHQSTNAPQPLTPLEEAILICCTGLTGVVMHDGPLKKASGAPEDLGSMFWNILARSGPSANTSARAAGGIDRATDGFVNPDNVVPLGAGYAQRTDYEA